MEDQKRPNLLNGHAQLSSGSASVQTPAEQGGAATQKSSAPTKGSATIEKTPTPEKKAASAATKASPKEETTAKLPAQKKRSGRVVWTIAGCFLLLFAALGSVIFFVLSNARNVTLYQVGAQRNIDQFVGGGGIVYPRQQLDLSYPAAERVVEVMVKAGDQVSIGQPLLKLDPTQLNAQITQAANDVAAAHAYLNSVSGTVNPVTVAQAQQQLQLAQNRYNALIAQTSSQTLKNGSLISPLKGIVTAVNINPGEVFGANTTLLTIMDQSTVTIRAKIPLSNLNQVKIGMPATISPSALPDTTLQGIVSSVIPQADSQTDTFEVWVEVKNPQMAILPGMSAFARIKGQANVFSIPRLAVLNPDHESTVFVQRGDKVFQKAVHVVSRAADVVYIDQGLSAGDKLVLIPLDKMHDGQQITVSRVEK